MYDFDAERNARHAAREAEFGEKPFTFAGEIFYVRPNVRYPAIKRVAEITEATGGVEVFDAVEAAVLAMIDPRDDAHERFHRACESDDDPITFEDLTALNNWLIRESTSRPPTPPESSATGLSKTGIESTVISSSETESV
jgi:hypothetical protein